MFLYCIIICIYWTQLLGDLVGFMVKLFLYQPGLPTAKPSLCNIIILFKAKKNPRKMFVQKQNNHRGIKIKSLNELDFTTTGTFIQEYIDNPLLIDGYKFDIGVYTIITSIDPLRVYMYNGDILFRYILLCSTLIYLKY